MMFAIRFTALVDAAGTVQTFVIATDPFVVGPTGSPANTTALGRLIDPGFWERTISASTAAGKLLFGLTQSSRGAAKAANPDGEFDLLPTYGIAGRDIELFAIDSDHPATDVSYFPGAWTQIGTATMVSITQDDKTTIFNVKEKFGAFDKPMCPNFTGAGDQEGYAELEGTPKPVVYGAPYNVSPVLIDKQQLIYMVSARNSVSGHFAKDGGSVIARALTGTGPDIELDAVVDYAALAAYEVPIGHYITRTSDGCLKLGSPLAGTLTVDAMQYGPGEAERSLVSEVLQDIAEDADPTITFATWPWIDFNTWADSSPKKRVGYFAKDSSTTFAQALSDIAGSVGAWVGFNRSGEFTVGLVTDPAGSASSFTIEADQIISIARVTSGDAGRGQPFGRIVQKYPRNWTPQKGSDLFGVVPDEVRAEVGLEYPKESVYACLNADDLTPTLTQFENAPDFVIESFAKGRRVTSTGVLETGTAAPSEDIGVILGRQRDWIEVKVPFTTQLFYDADLGLVGTITFDRYGLDAGKKMMVVAIRYELGGFPTATLTLWG